MSSETLARVLAAVDELGFKPNAMARQFKSGHLPMLGLLVPSIANPFFGSLAREVEEAARQRGYGLLLCNTRRDSERELEYADALLAQGVRGVIVGAALRGQDNLLALRERGLVVLGFDRQDRGAGAPMDTVSVNNVLAAQLATGHLTSLGHKHIVYVTGPTTSANRLARRHGFESAAVAARIAPVVWEGGSNATYMDGEMAELGRTAALELCQSTRVATGFVAMNDMVAIGLMAGLRMAGLLVPDDVSVVGIDDMFLSAYCAPALTTVRQPLHEMADTAVEQLVSRIQKPNRPFEQKVFQPELIVRGSAAVPPRHFQTKG